MKVLPAFNIYMSISCNCIAGRPNEYKEYRPLTFSTALHTSMPMSKNYIKVSRLTSVFDKSCKG